jgi:hypothetical protein
MINLNFELQLISNSGLNHKSNYYEKNLVLSSEGFKLYSWNKQKK